MGPTSETEWLPAKSIANLRKQMDAYEDSVRERSRLAQKDHKQAEEQTPAKPLQHKAILSTPTDHQQPKPPPTASAISAPLVQTTSHVHYSEVKAPQHKALLPTPADHQHPKTVPTTAISAPLALLTSHVQSSG